jgi:hypothetical protein
MKIKPYQRHKLISYLKQFYAMYPFEKRTIFHCVKAFKNRLRDNKDAWAGVSGETGSGKSLFVLMFMILFGRPLSLKDNVCYIPTGNEIMDKFNQLTFNTMLIDEAAAEMRAVNWHSKQQQQVNQGAMTERYKNNMVFMNMPNFNEFTKSMRTGSLIFRFIIPYRTENYARVILQRKSRNWRSDDPWGDKLANDKYDKFEKRRKEITNDVILEIERGLPNTLMDFIIPNLEKILPEITEEYKRLKIESRHIKGDEVTPNKDLYKEKYEEVMNRISKILMFNELNLGKVRVTKTEIASSLNVSVQTLNKYLEKPLLDNSKANFRNQQIDETPLAP